MDLLRQWSDKYPKADKWLLSPVYIQLDLQFGISAEVCFGLAADTITISASVSVGIFCC